MNGKVFGTIAIIIQTIVLLIALFTIFTNIEHRLTRVETMIQMHINLGKK